MRWFPAGQGVACRAQAINEKGWDICSSESARSSVLSSEIAWRLNPASRSCAWRREYSIYDTPSFEYKKYQYKEELV